MLGSRVCCSKNIHGKAVARLMRSSGTRRVPAARYHRMAFDSAKITSRLDFQQRYLAGRIHRQKIRRVAVAL